jgi:hypothetical protein
VCEGRDRERERDRQREKERVREIESRINPIIDLIMISIIF